MSDIETTLVVEKGKEVTTNPECNSAFAILSKEDYTALVKQAKSIKAESAVVITPIYKEFASDETVVGVFSGLSSITPNKIDQLTGEVIGKQKVTTIVWMGANGRLYQHGGVALVNQFWDAERNFFIIPPGTKVTISYQGKSGKAKLFDVGVVN